MTLEQAFITAIGTLAGVVSLVTLKLWGMVQELQKRSDACEADRAAMHLEISSLKEKLGEAKGTLGAHARCPAENCPFRP